MGTIINSQQSNKVWQWCFMGLSAVFIVLMPFFSVSHGQTGDEWTLIIYGNDIYDYFFNHSTKALNYDGQSLQVEGLHYYGGLYDFTVTFLHKKMFATTDELTFRHIINSIIGALLFLYTGLIAKHFAGWRAGFFALIFIALSPRILGESMNNPKDIPFAFANVFFLYYLLRYIATFGIAKEQWKYAILMGLGFGLAMGFRIGGILMIPYTVLFLAVYYWWDKSFQEKIKANTSKALKIILANLTVSLVIGYIIGIMFWPWALEAPLSRPLEALNAMTNRQIFLRMLFEGQFIMNNEVPWYYTTKWIFMSSPILILIGFFGSVVLIVPLAKRFGKTTLFLLLFTLVFPVVYAVYKNSTIYDTWRHFFFIYPSMVILAALLFEYFIEKFADKKSYQYGIIAFMVVGMALPLMWILRSFPNEYVYFNEMEGGAKKAYGVYDFDYYQNSGKQDAQWILANAKPKSGKIIIASNLSGYSKYFLDTNKYAVIYARYNDRDAKDWDYYVTYSRFIPIAQLENNTWPPTNAVHTIKVDDIPISAVLERKSKKDFEANTALEKQQLDLALSLYQQSVQDDASNDMVFVKYATVLASKGMLREALVALDKAMKIDSSNPAVYNLQAQIYNAMGDRAHAQQAQAMMQQLTQK
jgi:hypothetical protein